MLEETLFMIRNGAFGTDYSTKLIVCVIGILICLYDWKVNKRKDYFWVFLIGTIGWLSIEYLIQMRGIRVTEAYMFGTQLSVFFASLLRGGAEGGFVILFGLFFADRINKRWAIPFVLLIGLLVFMTLSQAMPSKDGFVSKRDLLSFGGLIYMGTMILFDAVWLYKTKPKVRKRALGVLGVMIITTGAWTIAEFFANTRWIALGAEIAPTYLQFLGLGYDVIVEIALAYLPYLGLAYLFGLIKEK